MLQPTSLAEVRERIDALDQELTVLLARREELVREVMRFKSDEQAVRAPDRAAQVVAAARARASRHGLSPDVAEAVWRAMIDAFIDLELDDLQRRHTS